MMKRVVLVFALVVSGVLVESQVQSEVSAQPSEVAWYRLVVDGRSAGTMTRWRRVDAGAAATFPFMDDFEVNIRPANGAVNATVRDGQTQFTATISCIQPNAPRRAMLTADRAGDDQPVITVSLQCSATEPAAR
jgi:hypothetical protein